LDLRAAPRLLGAHYGDSEIAPGWLRVLLGGMRFACRRPKHTLSHLRDPEEVAACEAELKEAEKK
jgi:hypothetical protein